ncbi:MAG: hypothetical protein CMB11_00315 [Euryarchaeota archaeon]|nr:hypothetical protein [Euryarchaeota archaeon]
MLPRVNVIVPTDEFYELSVDEERDLNEDGNGDPIMGEDFQRARGPNDDGATFRIRSYAADGTTPVYQYYIAQHLWQWARRGNRTDPNRIPWQYSDWMALRNQFEPTFPVPNWVQDMEFNNLRAVHNGGNQTEYWNDNHTPPRLVRVENANGITKHFYYNDTVQRQWVQKITYAAPYDDLLRGSVQKFVFYNQPDPAKQNYNSDTNWSQLVSWHNPGKWLRTYSGPGSGGERLSQQMFHMTNEIWHYACKPGDARGEEYKWKIEFGPASRLAGQTWFFQGTERGMERLVEVSHEGNIGEPVQVDIYEGLASVEQKVETRFKDPNGNWVSIFFSGAKRLEKVTRVVAWGQEHTPQPPQGQGQRLGFVHESAVPAADDDGVDTDNGDESESSDDGDDSSYYL